MQSLLTRKQRRENIKNAYEVKNQEKIRGKKIILFDDVYTTGATINECKRVLNEAGAGEILILTLAKD